MTRWSLPVLAAMLTALGLLTLDRDAASAATVNGTIARENAGPIPFADIRVCPEGSGQGSGQGSGRGCLSTVSDSEGSFRLDVPEGRYDVRTTLPNGAEHDRVLDVGGEEGRLEIVVPR